MLEPDPHRPPPAFKLEREPAPDGVVLLAMAGEIDLATSGHFRESVEVALGAGSQAMVLDMAEVTFMDSTMLRELLRAHKDLDASGGRLVLAAAQPAIRRLLELTGTTGLFELVPDRDEALAAVASGE